MLNVFVLRLVDREEVLSDSSGEDLVHFLVSLLHLVTGFVAVVEVCVVLEVVEEGADVQLVE